ncbi:hypothetical protein [Streptomyces sp. NRRL B-24484]|uniref:hypothetical protein n=1 Tax=Streptomyces sp. NRRL B-24484 TaxID=1463833 RepID=UPI0004C0957C|nr:hypothetical protein [Streptomyces sp. NRRL B-24484]
MSISQPRTDDPAAIPTGAEPAPVFVDESGTRGRLLRHLGWMVGGSGLLFTVGMVVSLFGAVAQAPPLELPDSLASSTAVPSPQPVPTVSASPSPTSSKATQIGHPGASGKPSGSASKSGTAKATASHSAGTKTSTTAKPGTTVKTGTTARTGTATTTTGH